MPPLKLPSLAAQTEGEPLMGQSMIGFGYVMGRKLVGEKVGFI